jgi:hypothetical protein
MICALFCYFISLESPFSFNLTLFNTLHCMYLYKIQFTDCTTKNATLLNYETSLIKQIKIPHAISIRKTLTHVQKVSPSNSSLSIEQTIKRNLTGWLTSLLQNFHFKVNCSVFTDYYIVLFSNS